MPEGQWRQHLTSLGNDVAEFGARTVGFTLLTCVRLPSMRQKTRDDCGIHAIYNAHRFGEMLGAPSKEACSTLMSRLVDSVRFDQTTSDWEQPRTQLTKTQGLHLQPIAEALGERYVVLPLLETESGNGVFEVEELPRVSACVKRLRELRGSPGACVFVAGRVQFGGTETHALAGILRSYTGSRGVAWEIIYADSQPDKFYDDDTLRLFDRMAKLLDDPASWFDRSKRKLNIFT